MLVVWSDPHFRSFSLLFVEMLCYDTNIKIIIITSRNTLIWNIAITLKLRRPLDIMFCEKEWLNDQCLWVGGPEGVLIVLRKPFTPTVNRKNTVKMHNSSLRLSWQWWYRGTGGTRVTVGSKLFIPSPNRDANAWQDLFCLVEPIAVPVGSPWTTPWTHLFQFHHLRWTHDHTCCVMYVACLEDSTSCN